MVSYHSQHLGLMCTCLHKLRLQLNELCLHNVHVCLCCQKLLQADLVPPFHLLYLWEQGGEDVVSMWGQALSDVCLEMSASLSLLRVCLVLRGAHQCVNNVGPGLLKGII